MDGKDDLNRQIFLYFLFVILMIILNYGIQKLNQLFLAPLICSNFGSIEIIHALYCSIFPFNMPDLIGSIAAVGITYIIKFFLDKIIVFKKGGSQIKETSKEFLKYFGFAILTTIENVGIQFLLNNLLNSPLEISIIIALPIGYLTKFYFDRKYVFNKKYS